MARRLLRIGLTGGIATGKSSCLSHFAAMGIPTIDADRIARDLVAPGTPGLEAVVARFGSAILAADGTLDRGALGRVVFADAQARHDLEAIIHPGVFAVLRQWFAAEAARVTSDRDTVALAVADVPLLFEKDSRGEFDRVVVAACPPDEQLARLMARDGLTEADARQRIATQIPIDDKRAQADVVIDTSGSVEETKRQVERLIEKFR